MSLFIMEPKALSYVEYLNAFCSDEAEAEAKRDDAVEFIEKTDRKKDGLICDLLKTALNRRAAGMATGEIMTALENEFELCGLNEKLNFQDMLWFFNFYIEERQRELLSYSEHAVELLKELYEHTMELPDGVYKINMCLFFLQSLLDLQVLGRMSQETNSTLQYLSDYDLTDETLQKELMGVFQLTLYVTPEVKADTEI